MYFDGKIYFCQLRLIISDVFMSLYIYISIYIISRYKGGVTLATNSIHEHISLLVGVIFFPQTICLICHQRSIFLWNPRKQFWNLIDYIYRVQSVGVRNQSPVNEPRPLYRWWRILIINQTFMPCNFTIWY